MNRYNYLPLFVCAGLFVVAWFLELLRGGAGKDTEGRWHDKSGRVAAVLAILLIAGYVFLVLYYVGSPTHLDHAEPAIASCAQLLLTGQPVYHDLESAARYSMLYGPATYCWYAVALWALPGGFLACKVLAAAATLGALGLGTACLRKRLQGRSLLVMTGLMFALFMANAPNVFWTRADPLICLCVAFALWAAIALKPAAAIPAIGIACGLAVNLKINAAFHFLFPLLFLGQRAGWKAVGMAILGAVVTACLLFLPPNISFFNWLRILFSAGKVGFGPNEILWSAQWLLFLGLPILIPWWGLRKARSNDAGPAPGVMVCWLGIPASLGAQFVFASKAGSDPTQFVPLIPVVLYGSCLLTAAIPVARQSALWAQQKWLRPLAAAFFLTAAILGGYQCLQITDAIRRQNPFARAVKADLIAILTSLRGQSIAMGCGQNETEFFSNQFLPLIWAGNPYLIEPVAMMEFEKAGLPLPPATRDLISKATVDVWLIPRNNPPFSMLNPYRPHRPLFDVAFRQSFETHYQKVGASRFFDVYARKSAPE